LIVGDVHGCREEVEALLEAVAFVPHVDRLVFVGDVVVRGPDPRGMLALARRLEATIVRGNHEQKLLAGRAGAARLGADHQRVADVLSPEAVVLSHTGASGGLADRIVGRRQATLLIGPEPGFSDEELDLARARGVAVATFGPVVLRTETAAVVAAALALRELGFLG